MEVRAELLMTQLLIFLLFLGIGYASDIKYLRACRPEDGFRKCDGGRCISYQEDHIQCDSTTRTLFPVDDQRKCNDDEFQCRIQKRCIPRRYLNTYRGCPLDDEEKVILPCRYDEFTCTRSKLCVPRWAVHDGQNDCSMKQTEDNSDETTEPYTECLRSEFRCKSSGRCIPREWVLDGENDCKDLYQSDEQEPMGDCQEEFRCRSSGRCIPRYRVKDGFGDCYDMSDEKTVLMCQNNTEFLCGVTGRCIPRSWINDEIKNCPDASDEMVPDYYKCTKDEFPCHNGKRCLPSKYLCDGMDHCGDCSDEIEPCLRPSMTRCPGKDRNTCIPYAYVCDRYKDCPSGIDLDNSTTGFKFQYKSNNFTSKSCVVPQWMLKDFAFCKNNPEICFETLNHGMILSTIQVCDGVLDSRDLSDECLCVANRGYGDVEELCDSVCYNTRSPACDHCNVGQVYCTEDDLCLNQSQLCDLVTDCPKSGLDEKYCKRREKKSIEKADHDFNCWGLNESVEYWSEDLQHIPVLENFFTKTAKRCDGVIECARFEDECAANCSTTLDACNMYRMTSVPKLFNYDVVTLTLRKCPQKSYSEQALYLSGGSICNGLMDCEGGEDEKDCPERYYCEAREMQYMTTVKRVISIAQSKICDGRVDCTDWSDELNCISSNPFSSTKELIDISFLRNMIWLMGFFAIVGNFGVIIETAMLEKTAASSGAGKCNRNMIVNLAVADFFMGLSLFILGVQSIQFSGEYALHDLQWRTSVWCSYIGIITVVSSETSVFTLLILTLYRVYGVYFPFQSKSLRSKSSYIAISLSWMLSVIIALIPVIPYVNNSTITEILITPTAFFPMKTVNWDNLHTFATRIFGLGYRTHNTSTEITTQQYWNALIEKLNTEYPEWTPEVNGYLGYYSAHGVCFPRLFNERSHPLHPLSIFLIVLNFTVLVVIILAYYLIYRKSTEHMVISDSSVTQQYNKRNRQMQQKITLLIVTDVCCWLPICIISFLSQGEVSISRTVYVVAAVVLLPINSSLNPLIYSNGFALTRSKLKEAIDRAKSEQMNKTPKTP